MKTVTCNHCGASIELDDVEYFLEDEDNEESQEHTICSECEEIDTFDLSI